MGLLPDEILNAIGKVVVNSAFAELQLQVLIWVLLGQDQRIGQVVTSEMSGRALRALAASLLQERTADASLREQLRLALVAADDAERRRNEIVHSAWTCDDHGRCSRLKITAKQSRGWQLKREWLDAEALKVLNIDLIEVGGMFGELTKTLDRHGVVTCDQLPVPGPENEGQVRFVRGPATTTGTDEQ